MSTTRMASRHLLVSLVAFLIASSVSAAFAHAPPPEIRPKPTLFEAIDIARGEHATPVEESVRAFWEGLEVTPSRDVIADTSGWFAWGVHRISGVILPDGESASWARWLSGVLSPERWGLASVGAPAQRGRKRVRISSHFGMRFHPVLGRWRLHNGVDFAAPTGTPVRAASAGIVKKAGWRGAAGKLVIIDHLDGHTTAYAHLSAIRSGLSAGDPVARGSVIGEVGTTGRSTGPHLHFVVRRLGEPVDPLTIEGFDYLSPIEALEKQLHYRRQVLPLMATLGIQPPEAP